MAAFSEEAKNPDEQAQCRFPARYAWLDSKLHFDPANLAPRACPLLDRWKQKLSAQSVSVVFASAYLDNPSSMYGHTFLLIHHAGRPADERLLDYAVNYAARADTANGVLFAIDGLAGVFPGRYSAMPYYLKVQEYSNLESRDLWEYRLNLSSATLGRLINHIWEMRSASFPYYFFNRNCSYELLPLLDAADPRPEFGARMAALRHPAGHRAHPRITSGPRGRKNLPALPSKPDDFRQKPFNSDGNRDRGELGPARQRLEAA
ncbi:MAG TPA: DUF4105 domain-containing protein [Elusimicrobiota bacterium]|nr:DUF4105 domain-containing protein [Elusimicrobiota bacterium]